MSWPTGNVPADITALRTALNASATWTAASGLLAQIHYPVMTWAGVTLPAALLVGKSLIWQSYGDGSGSIPRGEMEIVLYGSGLVGVMETLAQGIAQDLPRVQGGLLVREATCSMCGDVQPGEYGAIDDSSAPTVRAIIISLSHGLNP